MPVYGKTYGAAKSESFILGEATLMVGPQATFPGLLTADEHSIGLTKNAKVTSTPESKDLTQGLRQDIAWSENVGYKWTIETDAFEFSPEQMAYGMGLDGMSFSNLPARVKTLTTAAAAVNTDVLTVADVTDFQVGQWVHIIGEGAAASGLVNSIKEIDATAKTITLDRKMPVALRVDSIVKSGYIISGNTEVSPIYSAKIAGKLVNGDPIVLLLPKVKISSGVGLQFGVGDYAKTTFALKPLSPMAKDPHYDFYVQHGENQIIPVM